MKQRETLQNEQVRERIAMDCSCRELARKPQPEDEFHKVVPGLSLSSRILRTVAAVVLTFGTSPVDYFLLGAWSRQKGRAFSSVLKVKFLGNLIKNHTFLQVLPYRDRLPGKVTKIDFIMYSWHNLDNTRCKIRGKSMEKSNTTYRPWLRAEGEGPGTRSLP